MDRLRDGGGQVVRAALSSAVQTILVCFVIGLSTRSLCVAQNIESATTQAAVLREVSLYSMPVGSDPAATMSDERCEDGDEGACISGLAEISEADEIYVYDPPNNNLKVFSPAGTRVIVGPENLGVAANLV
jgi:hypothetical protein